MVCWCEEACTCVLELGLGTRRPSPAHPTPIFSAYCIESDGSQTSQGKKKEAFKVKKRERDYELLWVLF